MSVSSSNIKPKRILVSANMGPGTLRAKILPLASLADVKQVLILRKEPADVIPKVSYLRLPTAARIPLLHLLLHPIYLAFYAMKYRVDLIIGYHFVPYAFFAHLASIISRKPFIVAQTGLLIQDVKKGGWKGKWITKITAKALYLFTPGNESRLFWQARGVEPAKIVVLHSTIDTTIFKRNEGKETFDFVFVGRLNPIKQIELIISGFKQIHQRNPLIKLLIVGDGPSEESLKKLVLKLELGRVVEFTGFQANVKKYLDMAPFFVMASKSEGLPCAIMEAMSNGNIVLSTMVGNIPDLIKPGQTGIPIAENTAKSVEHAMSAALAMTAKQKSVMIDEGRSLIKEHHSFNSVQKKWSKLLSSLE
jgi:glycosyltransferase involved in cell wall biosynthesis